MPVREKDRKRKRRQRRKKKLEDLKQRLEQAKDKKSRDEIVEKIKFFQPRWEPTEEE